MCIAVTRIERFRPSRELYARASARELNLRKKKNNSIIVFQILFWEKNAIVSENRRLSVRYIYIFHKILTFVFAIDALLCYTIRLRNHKKNVFLLFFACTRRFISLFYFYKKSFIFPQTGHLRKNALWSSRENGPKRRHEYNIGRAVLLKHKQIYVYDQIKTNRKNDVKTKNVLKTAKKKIQIHNELYM